MASSDAPFEIPGPKEQVLPQAENLLKAVLLLVMLFASFWLAGYLASTLGTTSGVFVLLMWPLLVIFNVVLLTGMGILAHDAVHRVLFKSAFWNELWGGLLSAFALIPFNANRQFHLTHHSYAHQPDLDPRENAQHEHSFIYAATVGSALALNAQYLLLLQNLKRLSDTATQFALSGMWLVSVLLLDLLRFFASFKNIYMVYYRADDIAIPAGIPRFSRLVRHYGVPPNLRDGRPREVFDVAEEGAVIAQECQREVSGWVVLTSPALEWLWSHVNYHEVHHKYPYLSHRYLPQVFAATRGKYPYSCCARLLAIVVQFAQVGLLLDARGCSTFPG